MKQTSIEAYKSILDDLPNRQREVLTGLIKIGSGTFREIAEAGNIPESTVWKRLSELRKKGLVKDDKTTFCKISKRVVTLWELT